MIIALVGMPGSGKTVAANYLEKEGWARIRFGQITQDKLEEKAWRSMRRTRGKYARN